MNLGVFDSGRYLKDLTPRSNATDGRHPAERDFDEVVFSEPFRRLARKTQIFPMVHDDTAHNRLIHSLECASVARSLGRAAAELCEMDPEGAHAGDVATTVAAAALLHDIGNPPFGHAGECAINAAFGDDQDWYRPLGLSGVALRELRRIDGNAIGLHLLLSDRFTLNPTTIMCATKRPWAHTVRKKFSVLECDLEVFSAVASAAGVPQKGESWVRHPLSFMMEAADDICYLVMDLVDAVKLGVVSEQDGIEELSKISNSGSKSLVIQRDSCIRLLVEEAKGSFERLIAEVLGGYRTEELMQDVDSRLGGSVVRLKDWERKNVYSHPPILQLEASGFAVIGDLIRKFSLAVARKSTALDKRLFSMLPSGVRGAIDKSSTNEDRVLAAVVYVAGMTDRYALEMYQSLNGIRLPHHLP